MATTYTVTRFCCRSGMCIQCRAVERNSGRKRIVHAANVTKGYAERCLAGWAEFDPRMFESSETVVDTEPIDR